MPERLRDADQIERRLLDLAHTTDAKLTAPALAYFAPCSLDDAARVLEDLAARDRVSMDVEDDGTIVYTLLGRQKLAPAVRVPPLQPQAMVPVRASRPASPVAAMALSLFVPGAGHLYAGKVVSALLWFLVVSMGYVLILPGLVLHLFAIASAGKAARRLNEPRRHFLLPSPAYH